MSPARRRPTVQRRSWPAAIGRALVSLGGLAALLGAVPYLLLHLGTLPAHAPTWSGARNALTQPDDGSLLFTVLTLAAWAVWVWCVLPLLIEIIAVLARRTTPRLPGLGAPQRLAGFLVGGVLLIATPATAMAAAPPAVAVAPHADDAGQGPAAATGQTDRTEARQVVVHQVGEGEHTVWDLAEQHLGDGMRYREILDLNPGLTHVQLTEGMTIKLPAGTHTTPNSGHASSADGVHTDDARTSPAAPSSSPRSPTYTVRSGDSLSGIAERKLHDADAWPKIYDLNKGESLPDGRHFTDPDLIYPGQQLDLPATADGTSSTSPGAPAQENPHTSGNDQAQPTTSAPATPEVTPAPSTAPVTSAPQQTPVPTAPSSSSTASESTTASNAPSVAPHSPSPTTIASAPTGSAHTVNRNVLFMLGAGLLAASVLTALAARRIWQQRSRRRGHRIAMPTGSAAATERALRATEDPTGTTFIDAALRTATVHLTQAGRELPDLAAAVYGPGDGLTLHLASPAAPVPPFTAIAGDLTRWHCPAQTNELLGSQQTSSTDAPYPSLVAIGGDEAGRTVLVDLEHYGIVRISGPGRQEVMRAIAVDLATSLLATCMRITTVGPACPGLAEQVPERFPDGEDPATAVREFASSHASQQQALTAVGADSMRLARTGETIASWTPHILLAADDFDPAAWQRLADATSAHPRSATAIVTTSTACPAERVSWDIVADGNLVTVPGTQVTCIPLALSEGDYADIIDALATTEQPDVPPVPVPAPAEGALWEPEAATDLTVSARGYTDEVHLRLPSQPTGAEEPATPPQAPGDEAAQDLIAQLAGDLEEGTDEEDTGEEPAGQEEQKPPAPQTTEAPPTPGQEIGVEPAVPAANIDSPIGESSGESSAEAVIPTASPVSVPAPLAPPAPATPPPAPPQAAEQAGPMIRVLGPVDITGARGKLDNRYKRTPTELAAWMILHPGGGPHALAEAVWPGKDVDATRDSAVSRLRSWLGTNTAGEHYLPWVAATADASYRFGAGVACDWYLFEDLVRTGTDDALRSALELVRARPFSGVPARRYVWAEPLMQDMISAIVDAAADLGERRLAVCDPRGALWAVTTGLNCAPEMEVLHRIAFRAHDALGNREDLERAVQRLEDILFELQVDMDDETSDLLHTLA
jgi:nucleoid-associated protein YgaU